MGGTPALPRIRFLLNSKTLNKMNQVLIIFGTIVFDKNTATVYHIDHVEMCDAEIAEESAEADLIQHDFNAYLIPQKYTGTITWNKVEETV